MMFAATLNNTQLPETVPATSAGCDSQSTVQPMCQKDSLYVCVDFLHIVRVFVGAYVYTSVTVVSDV